MMIRARTHITLALSFLMALLPVPAPASTGTLDHWLDALRQEASRKGISSSTFDAALSGFRPNPKILALDQKQPEKKITFAQYRKNVVTDGRIAEGRALMKQHAAVLRDIESKYGVQPQYVIALWGIETSYGKVTGGFDVPKALATLAWDGRRSEFFRNELLTALAIIEEGHISAQKMQGSWAGAMGQNQFMPTSFMRFAVDADGDGHRNIWGSLRDVFASTANYLHQNGWTHGQRWGRAVHLPKGFPESMIGLESGKSLEEWAKIGVTLPGGAPLPRQPGLAAYVVAPDGLAGQTYLVYSNYRTIMSWNRSTYFATSVGLLADAIASPGP